MSKKDLVVARSESSCADHREIQRRRCQSQLSVREHLRSSSQQATRPPACNIQIFYVILLGFLLLL
jgi:hypothetical protein